MRLLATLFVLAISASAQDSPKVDTFGMVGLAGGQTARLNVLNMGSQAPGAATTCLVSLLFLDDQGALLKTNTLEVGPARSVSLDLDADKDLALAATQRRQIRGLIAPIPEVPPPGGTATCVLMPTLEIFDRLTGKTSIVMASTMSIPRAVPPTPQP
jgi:hypothetical protein